MEYELTDHARESLRNCPVIRLEWLESVLVNPTKLPLQVVTAYFD